MPPFEVTPTCFYLLPRALPTQAVFFTSSTEEGMSLFFMCTSCSHRWRDNV